MSERGVIEEFARELGLDQEGSMSAAEVLTEEHEEISRAELNEIRRRELLRIEEQDGAITPAAVVDAARSPSSPLHDWFEWDDTEAAEKYRQAQARQLIRVVYLRDDDAAKQPAFYHVTIDEQPQYVSTVRLQTEPELFASALRELLRKLSIALDSVDKVTRIKTTKEVESVRDLLSKAKTKMQRMVD